VLCLAAVCAVAGGCDGDAGRRSAPARVDCAALAPDSVPKSDAEELARVIQLQGEAKILEHVDAHPELVCARLTLETLPPNGWKSWRRARVSEEVGVAGFVAVRRDRPEALLAALFQRGAPHGRVLGLAARSGRDALVAWLLRQGVDPGSGDALVEAAAAEGLPAVEALLAAGVDPDQRPSAGSLLDDGSPTPLFFAIYTRRPDIASALLDAGASADAVTAWGRPGDGATLLEWAVFMRLWPLTAGLIEAGADPGALPYDVRRELERAARSYGLRTVLAALGF
jgi:hypothetical protein